MGAFFGSPNQDLKRDPLPERRVDIWLVYAGPSTHTDRT